MNLYFCVVTLIKLLPLELLGLVSFLEKPFLLQDLIQITHALFTNCMDVFLNLNLNLLFFRERVSVYVSGAAEGGRENCKWTLH